MKNTITFVLPLLACFLAFSVSAEEIPDSRGRSFVPIARIIALYTNDQAQVVEPELLLQKKHGQVCEKRFAHNAGTKLVNRAKSMAPGILLDFGKELHGGLQLGMSPHGSSGARLRLCFGESVSEALSKVGGGKNATNNHALRDFEIPVPTFGAIEIGNTGFRFVKIELVTPGTVGFEFIRAISLMRPMKKIGYFKSSDERLNRIFETSVRTLHLCCQDYLWDGIKRDRLVWMGDMHPETMTLFNVYGADQIVPQALDYAAAITETDEWMSTMPTYTLWWIRNLAEWYRYTADAAYVRKHAEYLEKTFDHVLTGFDKNGKWTAGTFLDWPTSHNNEAQIAGTQALAYMTAKDMALLAKALQNAKLERKALQMAEKISKQAPFDPNGAKSAAALLVLSGLKDEAQVGKRALVARGHAGVSTFYGYYMIEALSAAGEHQRALDTVRDYWGAMLDVGATSFWEDFNLAWTNNCYRIDELPVEGKKDIHGDYGEFCYKGFRHSLCHAWSCGPASWCINNVLGIRALDIGCKTLRVEPKLGDLEYAEGAMALPDGQAVVVKARRRADGTLEVDVKAPSNVKVLRP